MLAASLRGRSSQRLNIPESILVVGHTAAMANLAVSRIMVEALKKLNPQFPEPTVDMAEIEKRYHAAKDAARSGGG